MLPVDLKEALDALFVTCNSKVLKEASESLSKNYRSGQSSHGEFQGKTAVLAYLATRLPATFGACSAVFKAVRDRCPEFACRSFLDLGAGPGTATWAALDCFQELSTLHLVEKERFAMELGQRLAKDASAPSWKTAHWQQAGLESMIEIPTVDLAALSYVCGELKEAEVLRILERLWDQKIPLVAVIEPGTPKGFDRIRKLRAFVIQKGARIVAPCPHEAACPMAANDWCHFSARIERTRLHRQLKEGTLGYEDEKYSYVVYAHPEAEVSTTPIQGRVLRHPQKGSGFVKLSLCHADGKIHEETVTRSHKAEYRLARDLEWGSVVIPFIKNNV